MTTSIAIADLLGELEPLRRRAGTITASLVRVRRVGQLASVVCRTRMTRDSQQWKTAFV